MVWRNKLTTLLRKIPLPIRQGRLLKKYLIILDINKKIRIFISTNKNNMKNLNEDHKMMIAIVLAFSLIVGSIYFSCKINSPAPLFGLMVIGFIVCLIGAALNDPSKD